MGSEPYFRTAGAAIDSAAELDSAGDPSNAIPSSLATIVAAHPRIHAVEAAFYREVMVHAAERNRLRSVVVAPSDGALASQASLAPLAKKLGRPRAKDERLAALAAWSLLAGH